MSLVSYRRLVVVLSFLTVFPLIDAFTFSFATPSECDDLALKWTGGTAPFQLNLIPVFGTPRNISIPSSAFNDGKGSFSFSLPFAQKSEIVITMSDANGFGTGGTTNVLTVQPSDGVSCDTKEPPIDFSFQLNTALQQCRPYVFSAYREAVQPVTIYVIIPGGNILTLNPPIGPNSFTWNANVVRSTSLIFMMVDANGRQGGSSDIKPVGFTDDTSCLDGSSPTSTANSPSASATGTPPSGTTPSSSASAAPAKGVSIAAVAGTVIGSLLFLAVAITLGLFFLRKRRDAAAGGFSNNLGRPPRGTSFGFDSGYNHPLAPAAPFTGAPLSNNFPPSSPYPYSPHSTVPLGSNPFLDAHDVGHGTASSQHLPSTRGQYQNSQFDASSEYLSSEPSQYQSTHPPPPSSFYQSSQFDASSMYAPSRYQDSEVSQHTRRQPSGQAYPPTQYPPPLDPFSSSGPPMLPGTEFESFSMDGRPEAPSTLRVPMSAAQRKASQAGSGQQRPTRFIVHTDVEDDLPPPNEEGVVELPPQYTERRGPPGSMNPPAEKAGPPPGAYPL